MAACARSSSSDKLQPANLGPSKPQSSHHWEQLLSTENMNGVQIIDGEQQPPRDDAPPALKVVEHSQHEWWLIPAEDDPRSTFADAYH